MKFSWNTLTHVADYIWLAQVLVQTTSGQRCMLLKKITIRIFLCSQISTGVSIQERLTQSLICKYVGSNGIRSRVNVNEGVSRWWGYLIFSGPFLSAFVMYHKLLLSTCYAYKRRQKTVGMKFITLLDKPYCPDTLSLTLLEVRPNKPRHSLYCTAHMLHFTTIH